MSARYLQQRSPGFLGRRISKGDGTDDEFDSCEVDPLGIGKFLPVDFYQPVSRGQDVSTGGARDDDDELLDESLGSPTVPVDSLSFDMMPIPRGASPITTVSPGFSQDAAATMEMLRATQSDAARAVRMGGQGAASAVGQLRTNVMRGAKSAAAAAPCPPCLLYTSPSPRDS